MTDKQEDGRVVRRPQTLVSYCQRVLTANMEGITSLGGEVPYRLVEPILRLCPADVLARIEQDAPHLWDDNEALWKHLCFKDYPILVERYTDKSDDSEPWREVYITLKATEANRLETLSNRIRAQRQEAEAVKKNRQVKLTDRVPPAKRPRWGPTQPKTLFEKTMAEASKLQSSAFGARLFPPMPPSKTWKSNPSPAGVSLNSGFESAAARPVKIRTVVQRKVAAGPNLTQLTRPASSTNQGHSRSSKATVDIAVKGKQTSTASTSFNSRQYTQPTSPPPRPTWSPETSPPTSPPPVFRRDPMASLFMPKHRAHSQLPQPVRSRNVP